MPSLDLHGPERDIANDRSRYAVANHGRARHPTLLIAPGMPPGPLVQRLPPAIEPIPIILGSEWPPIPARRPPAWQAR
jgi:hypothetical protein